MLRYTCIFRIYLYALVLQNCLYCYHELAPCNSRWWVLDNTGDRFKAVQPDTLAREDGFWNKNNYSYFIAGAAFVYCL